MNFFFKHFTSVFPSIGGWTVPALQDFCWSGEPFYVRMPFLTTTNDVYVGARTFNPSIESPTRNLYTTADFTRQVCHTDCLLLMRAKIAGNASSSIDGTGLALPLHPELEARPVASMEQVLSCFFFIKSSRCVW